MTPIKTTTLIKLLAVLDFQPLDKADHVTFSGAGDDALIADVSDVVAQGLASAFGDFISVPDRKNIESGTVVIGGDANQIEVFLYDNMYEERAFQIPFEVN